MNVALTENTDTANRFILYSNCKCKSYICICRQYRRNIILPILFCIGKWQAVPEILQIFLCSCAERRLTAEEAAEWAE